jgi:MFS family permease
MMAVNTATSQKATYRQVFAEPQFRALWAGQLVSITGDQFARIALAVLVYGRTGSPLLSAAAFAVTPLAMGVSGLCLSWVADRFPRHLVMISSDIICLILVLVMAVPGVPPGVLIALLFAVGMASEPFLDARSATNRKVLGDRFTLGSAITQTTYQVAQLVGFGAGGVIAGVAGVRTALLIDAATFAVSALLVRYGVKPRPAADSTARPERPELLAGLRAVFASPLARTAMLLMWLAAFYGVTEGGVIVPLAHQLGGGAPTAGWLLAAVTGATAAGLALYARLAGGKRASSYAAILAMGACALLLLFLLPVSLAGTVIILTASCLCIGYQPVAVNALITAVPDEHRGQAMGAYGAGMYFGQGLLFIVAGAVAQHVHPSLVIAACGGVGAVAAVPLVFAWRKAAAAPAGR